MALPKKRAAARRAAPKKAKTKKASGKAPSPSRPRADTLKEALAWLERHGTKKTRDGMAGYGITAKKAFGVTMGDIRVLAKQLGTNHDLAVALWNTGVYEARMLTAFVADPRRLTAAQMDQWCRDFDSWAICDTLCFALFDRSPDAFDKVEEWSRSREEFIKRAAFALLACLALHGRGEGDAPFLKLLPLIERASKDDRNFVKKAVNWALRAIGGRSKPLHGESLDVARRLADSSDTTARWIGKDAQKALEGSATMKRLARKK
jgi:3-methyladenine DNA glycosylase AlkD